MANGIFTTTKKDGTIVFRASINRSGRKISLGTFSIEEDAIRAYKEAALCYSEKAITIDTFKNYLKTLSNDKAICMINLRDNGIYFKTPIYLRGSYFSYFLKNVGEFKFDNEDLFYYSSHTIMKRGGHFFVNDYGSQYSLISRYGIKPYAVYGRDYRFANEDPLDFRYENIIIINKYRGVTKKTTAKGNIYTVKIHINGEYNLGKYNDELTAAVCYNKGVDAANFFGIKKEYEKNYIEDLEPSAYRQIYDSISLPKKYMDYIISRSQK